jgi:hypothetical protein
MASVASQHLRKGLKTLLDDEDIVPRWDASKKATVRKRLVAQRGYTKQLPPSHEALVEINKDVDLLEEEDRTSTATSWNIRIISSKTNETNGERLCRLAGIQLITLNDRVKQPTAWNLYKNAVFCPQP